MESGDLKGKGFKALHNETAVRQMLVDAKEASLSIAAWWKGSEAKVAAYLLESDSADQPFTLALKDEESRVAAFWNVHEKQVLCFTMTFPSHAIAFLASDKWSIKDARVSFAVPEKAFVLQRRRHPRYIIPVSYEIPVTIPHHPSKHSKTMGKLADLSISGAGVYVPPQLLPTFNKDATLRQIQFSLQGQRVTVDGVIRNTRPGSGAFAGYGFVGIEFLPGQNLETLKIQNYVQSFFKQYSSSKWLESLVDIR